METQIIELEKKYWQGMEDHDYQTVKNLTRFPCIVAGKKGVMRIDEPRFKEMFESGANAKIKVINISNPQTQAIGENTAVIAYEIELSDGTTQNNTMKCACTSTWAKENGNWACVLHTESELEV